MGFSLIAEEKHILSCSVLYQIYFFFFSEDKMPKKLYMLWFSTDNKEKPSLNNIGKDGGAFMQYMIFGGTYCNLKMK